MADSDHLHLSDVLYRSEGLGVSVLSAFYFARCYSRRAIVKLADVSKCQRFRGRRSLLLLLSYGHKENRLCVQRRVSVLLWWFVSVACVHGCFFTPPSFHGVATAVKSFPAECSANACWTFRSTSTPK